LQVAGCSRQELASPTATEAGETGSISESTCNLQPATKLNYNPIVKAPK